MRVSGISFSSDRVLGRCEQQYFYKYEENLQKKIKSVGLFRGDWGHQLVEAHYTKGGPGWEAKFDDLVKTKWDPLFDEEKEAYGGSDFHETLHDLMEHYVDHWSDWDSSWEVLHVEREDKKMIKSLNVPVRWKSDLIVSEILRASTARVIRGHERRRNILVEHKFKKAIPSSEERILQPQVHSYAFLLSKVGLTIDSILWDYIRTEPVVRPQIKKNGELSVRKINTDKRGYIRSVREAGLYPDTGEGIQDLEETIKHLPVTLALERVRNSVNLKMGEMFVKDWVERARRAKETKRPLRSWGRNCKFDCDFYLLCQTDMRGDTGRDLVIIKNYEQRPKKAEELK